MKIAIVQSELIWENASANRERLEEKIQSINGRVDLVMLPEMFTTGFTMHPNEIAEPMNGETVTWMINLAGKNQFAICGSVIITENDKFYNRLLFVYPSGDIEHYDKRHLFTLAGEDKVYTSGKDRLIVDYKGFRICPMVCYDLRFPVFSRNTVDYDILIYVANWPQPRIAAWDALLKARAIENMCYVVGVNRIGWDNNNHQYIGHSQALDCLGNYLIEPNESDGVYVCELDKNSMLVTRQKLGFLNDRDIFTVN